MRGNVQGNARIPEIYIVRLVHCAPLTASILYVITALGML